MPITDDTLSAGEADFRWVVGKEHCGKVSSALGHREWISAPMGSRGWAVSVGSGWWGRLRTKQSVGWAAGTGQE